MVLKGIVGVGVRFACAYCLDRVVFCARYIMTGIEARKQTAAR